jgi:hypothetical protein
VGRPGFEDLQTVETGGDLVAGPRDEPCGGSGFIDRHDEAGDARPGVTRTSGAAQAA